MQKYVYIVLSSSSSLPAKMIRLLAHHKLNHSSITLDDSLHKMYSFGRVKMWNVLSGGFVVEDKDKGFYQKFTDTYIQLYRLPVDELTYNKTKAYLENCALRRKEFKYNFAGVFLYKFGIPLDRKNKFFCSEFVASVIVKCGIREIKRNIHTYHPNYFLELDDKELIYDGMLIDYSAPAMQESEPCKNVI